MVVTEWKKRKNIAWKNLYSNTTSIPNVILNKQPHTSNASFDVFHIIQFHQYYSRMTMSSRSGPVPIYLILTPTDVSVRRFAVNIHLSEAQRECFDMSQEFYSRNLLILTYVADRMLLNLTERGKE